MKPTTSLAAWAAETSRQWPDRAVNEAVRVFIDTVACILSGAHEPPVRKAHSAVARWGQGQSTVVGITGKGSSSGVPAPWAALINGTAAHSQDYDDVLDPALAHVSAVLVPALLALAEETGASGHRCVDAYLVGFEIMARLAEAVNPSHYRRGWHTTLTLGTPAAAVACARMIGLDRPQMQAALSLSTSMSSGSKRQFGTMTKPFHAGLAAKNGIVAAQLAAEGFTAADEILEGEWSLQDLMAGPDAPGFSERLAQIGDPPAIIQYGVWLKLYPCCASTHRSVDALLNLRRTHGLDAKNVTSIEAMISKMAADNLMYESPKDPMEARFSLHYCLASALVDDGLAPDAFTPKAIRRPVVRTLLPRIHKTIDPALSGNAGVRERATVTVTLADGKKIIDRVENPRGHPGRPLSDEELAAKFRACAAAGGLEEVRTERLYSTLRDFSSLPGVDAVTQHLCSP
jgi:2-methylcitrate dehydratase PrpD